LRILVFGTAGQVGRALTETASRLGWELLAPSRAEVDIADAQAVAACVRRSEPEAIVNAAGYTAVDRAETETDEAFRVNCDGALTLARAAAAADLPLVHLSSDYVFDGRAREPYTETDAVGPVSIYAKSKEAGERAVRESCPWHVILRTAWLYSPFGTNFLRTMLSLGEEQAELAIVDDQVGCPTAGADIADAITKILAVSRSDGFDAWGTYHCVGADAVTWYGFAKIIFNCGERFGLAQPKLKAVTTAEFPRPAQRPAYAVLSTAKLERTFGIRPGRLRDGVNDCLARLLG
jgi:dTDP-4-dehydrorhamnose reductase